MIIKWYPIAEIEFDKCVSYIAEKSSINTASKWKNKILKSLKTLEIFPKAGTKYGKEQRIWLPHRNYKVYYEIQENFVCIVRFRHSKRKPLEYKAK
jgi:plasmid stabilization system protein ParE